MKKLSIVLGILLAVALVFGIVTLSQKGDLQKKADELTAKLETAVSDKDSLTKQLADATAAGEAALAAAKDEGAAALTAAKEEADAALAAVKAEAETAKTNAEAALTAAKDEAEAALAAVKAEAETAKTNAEAALAAAKDEGAAALTAAKDEAAAALAAAMSEAEAALAAVKTEAETAKTDAEAALAAAKEEAAAALAAAKDEAEAQIAALTGEKDEIQKSLTAAEAKAADLETKVAALTKLAAADYTGKTIILHTNDVHGAVDGYAYIPALRDWFLKRGAEKVFVADAGDFSQGAIYVSTNQGAAAIELMNAAGYNVVTLGNHEFDYGYAHLMENLSKAEFAAICSNVILDETGNPILDAGLIVHFTPKDNPEGEPYLKVAFIGVETPETATKVNPGLIKEIHFTLGEELYTNVQQSVNAVRDKVDLVIGLCHLGVDAESAVNGYRSIDLLNHVTGIDFVIDAHSHTVMTAGENGEPIQSTGTAFDNIGVIVIDNETKKVSENFLIDTELLTKDEAVAAKAKEIMDAADAIYNAVFAKTEVLLNGAKAPGSRTEETNLGDLITDAMVWSVVKEGGIEQVEPNHVVGITNGGGIRATIDVGDVTKKAINTVMPFGNTVAVIYVTGEELLEALEASTFCTPDPVGGYPQTSGITWTLDTTKAFDQGEVYVLDGKESNYYKPATIQRVTIEKINGEPFDPAATYAVVTNNFCAAGGDTYNCFARAYSEGSGFDTGITMDEAVMAYVEQALNGVITAEAYGAPRGNLTQIK